MEKEKEKENVLKDKVLGMFIGGFIGDALGAPYEFRISRPLTDYRGLIEYEIKVPRRFHEPTILPIGSFTDDSQMTLHMIWSIISKQSYDRNDVILQYLNFANTSKMLGVNTRALLKGIKTLRGYERRVQRLMNIENQSNGPLMRASPLALFKDYNIWLSDTTITNINDANKICTIIYVYALRQAIMGYNKEDILSFSKRLSEQYNNKSIIMAVEQAKNNVIRNVDEKIIGSRRSNKGWVIHGLYCALWSLYNFEDYRTAIDGVILLGGDTDTNAKIAGDLLGAYYGYSKIVSDDTTKYNGEYVFNTNTNYLQNFTYYVDILTSLFEY